MMHASPPPPGCDRLPWWRHFSKPGQQADSNYLLCDLIEGLHVLVCAERNRTVKCVEPDWREEHKVETC